MLEAILNNLVFEWWFSKTYVNVLKPCDTCWLSDGMKTNEKWHTFYADSVMMSCQNIMWQKHKGRSWAERHRQFNQHRSQHSDDNCNITFHRPTHEAISQQGHCVKDLLPATQKAQPFREWTRQARHHWLRSLGTLTTLTISHQRNKKHCPNHQLRISYHGVQSGKQALSAPHAASYLLHHTQRRPDTAWMTFWLKVKTTSTVYKKYW